MKLKTIEVEGTTYAVMEGDKPVFIGDDGNETPTDVIAMHSNITTLNGEAMRHRNRAKDAEAKLKSFEGIEDPEKAREALKMVQSMDDKKLIDAGEAERLRASITKTFEEQLETSRSQTKELKGQLHEALIGASFNSSKFIQEKVAIPPEFVRSYFEKNFSIEDGKVVAKDDQGTPILSPANPTNPASVDEAIEHLISLHPQRDSLLKASGASGGGAPSGGGGSGAGQKSMTRPAFDKLSPAEQHKFVTGGGSLVEQ